MSKEDISLSESVKIFVSENKGYYSQWVFDHPIIVSNLHHQKIEKLQKIIHKVILHFVKNYKKNKELINTSNKVEEIVNSLENIPYGVGTYRTDFVFNEEMNPKLIEITCRFALNTLFLNSIYNKISLDYNKEYLDNSPSVNLSNELYNYIELLSNKGNIYILRGADLKNESVFFKEIFRRTGREIIEISYLEIDAVVDSISKDSFIISELTLNEIESLSLETIKKLSELNLVNDFRTALLIHDKQFFSVLRNQRIQKECLTEEESVLLNQFLIPTYGFSEGAEHWKDARRNKEKWILKHRVLGKSKSIYAGEVTSLEEWSQIFEKENLNEFILQKWVKQPKVKGSIKGTIFEDYVTGTYLFFNDNYFGLGPFRTSSHPVTNVVDDRKMTSITLSSTDQKLPKGGLVYLKT